MGIMMFLGQHSSALFAEYHLRVYAHWGDFVYESNLPSQGWNGKLEDGTSLPSDVYFFDYNLVNPARKKGGLFIVIKN